VPSGGFGGEHSQRALAPARSSVAQSRSRCHGQRDARDPEWAAPRVRRMRWASARKRLIERARDRRRVELLPRPAEELLRGDVHHDARFARARRHGGLPREPGDQDRGASNQACGTRSRVRLIRPRRHAGRPRRHAGRVVRTSVRARRSADGTRAMRRGLRERHVVARAVRARRSKSGFTSISGRRLASRQPSCDLHHRGPRPSAAQASRAHGKKDTRSDAAFPGPSDFLDGQVLAVPGHSAEHCSAERWRSAIDQICMRCSRAGKPARIGVFRGSSRSATGQCARASCAALRGDPPASAIGNSIASCIGRSSTRRRASPARAPRHRIAACAQCKEMEERTSPATDELVEAAREPPCTSKASSLGSATANSRTARV
jgi:hypothetical protein